MPLQIITNIIGSIHGFIHGNTVYPQKNRCPVCILIGFLRGGGDSPNVPQGEPQSSRPESEKSSPGTPTPPPLCFTTPGPEKEPYNQGNPSYPPKASPPQE